MVNQASRACASADRRRRTHPRGPCVHGGAPNGIPDDVDNVGPYERRYEPRTGASTLPRIACPGPTSNQFVRHLSPGGVAQLEERRLCKP